jgi:hypothetical protein
MDNERGIARASQAEWVEVVLATDGSERALDSSVRGFISYTISVCDIGCVPGPTMGD